MVEIDTIVAASKILNLDKEKLGQGSFTRLAGDASDRSYFRITVDSDKGKTYILMKMKKGFNSPAEEITKSEKNISELPFLNIHRFLKAVGIPVPVILGSDPDVGLIVLEDLGDDSLYSKIPSLSDEKTIKIYFLLIDEMVKFQLAKKPIDPCIAFFRKYDHDMCLWELDHFVEWGIESFLKIRIKEEEKVIIDSFFRQICKIFLSSDFYFCHRDYHSKNVMLKGSSPKIIDFQDALLAPQAYDLASLVRDSYVCLKDTESEQIVGHYIESFSKKSKEKFDKKDFFTKFDAVSIHRNLKAAGRFVYIEKKKQNSSYIQHIPRTLNYVRKNLKKYEFCREADSVLTKYFDLIEEKISMGLKG
jgi:N-acetylmuramate 1-kinase